MKREVLTTARNWIAGSVLLAGLIYSVSAITVSAKPVYASSCNCSEEELEAQSFCSGRGGVNFFQCPIGGPPDGPAWVAQCGNGLATGESCSGT
jgi:hypothetical protein